MKKTLSLILFAFILAGCCGDKYVSLFNGENLDGWGFVVDGNEMDPAAIYSVQNGMIHISGEKFGYMYTLKEYSDYDLEVTWAWDGKGSNSGVFINITELSNPFPCCIECNLMAGNAGKFVLLGGAMADEYVLPEGGQMPKFPVIDMKEESSELAESEWNVTKVEVRQGHIKAYVNGVLQNECTGHNKSGRIGLQSEGGPIWFKSVKIREY